MRKVVGKLVPRSRYKEYIRSSEWEETKSRFRENGAHKDPLTWNGSGYPPYCCARCLKVEGLNLHHKTYKRLGREWAIDCVWLCRDCHHFLHGKVEQLKAGGANTNIWKATGRMLRAARRRRKKKRNRKSLPKPEILRGQINEALVSAAVAPAKPKMGRHYVLRREGKVIAER